MHAQHMTVRSSNAKLQANEFLLLPRALRVREGIEVLALPIE